MSKIVKRPRLLGCQALLLALVLLHPSLASAAPITSGVWAPATGINRDQKPFWDGWSWDCPTCNAGYLFAAYTGLTGLEYLNNGSGSYVAFRFDEESISSGMVFNQTAWTGGLLGRSAGGAFTYDSGTGRISNSWESPGQYALFRRVGADSTQYFMGIEDILLSEPLNDRDYNDYGVTFTIPNTPVPEPSTLLLVGASLAGLAARRARRRVR